MKDLNFKDNGFPQEIVSSYCMPLERKLCLSDSENIFGKIEYFLRNKFKGFWV